MWVVKTRNLLLLGSDLSPCLRKKRHQKTSETSYPQAIWWLGSNPLKKTPLPKFLKLQGWLRDVQILRSGPLIESIFVGIRRSHTNQSMPDVIIHQPSFISSLYPDIVHDSNPNINDELIINQPYFSLIWANYSYNALIWSFRNLRPLWDDSSCEPCFPD